MKKPYIICHMVTSLDGKVTGNFLASPACAAATEVYYEINRNLACNGFICGRVTMEGSFTGGYYPDLSNCIAVADKQDYLPDGMPKGGFYAVSFDTHGRLGWKTAAIADEDPGYDRARIIEVLSEDTDARYLGYLQSLSIPYIFAGEREINVTLALDKLYRLFGVERILLEGGSIINGAFQRAGVIDELSLVVAPVVAEQEDKPLFFDTVAECYRLTNTTIREGCLCLRYKKET